MSSGVKFSIFLLIFLLIGGIVFFFVLWQPNAARTDELRQQIVAAEGELYAATQRAQVYPELRLEVERLTQELNTELMNEETIGNDWHSRFAPFLLDVFDADSIRSLVHRVVDPHSSFVTIDIMYSQPLSVMSYNNDNPHGPEGIWLTTVNIAFAADLQGIHEILTGFASETFDNRVVHFDMIRQGNIWAMTLQVDILSVTPYRHNGDYTLPQTLD